MFHENASDLSYQIFVTGRIKPSSSRPVFQRLVDGYSPQESSVLLRVGTSEIYRSYYKTSELKFGERRTVLQTTLALFDDVDIFQNNRVSKIDSRIYFANKTHLQIDVEVADSLFTPQQVCVLEQLLKGYKQEEIADNLSIDKNTIAKHIKGGAERGFKNKFGILGNTYNNFGVRPRNALDAIFILIKAGVILQVEDKSL